MDRSVSGAADRGRWRGQCLLAPGKWERRCHRDGPRRAGCLHRCGHTLVSSRALDSSVADLDLGVFARSPSLGDFPGTSRRPVVYRLCFRSVDPDPSRSPPGNTLPGCPLRPFAATTAGRLTCIINASRYHPHCLRRGFRVATSRWGAVSRLGRNLLSVSGPRYYRRPV